MPPLSPTEKRFLELYDEGKSYKEICAELDISLSTAKTHSRRIIIKTMATCLRHAAFKRRSDLAFGMLQYTAKNLLPIARLPAAA